MMDKWKSQIMKIKITNEKMLFDILANEEGYKNLQEVEFDDAFLNSIQFRLKIEGKTLDNIPIHGHITTDLLNVCNAWQNTIYSIYASVIKGRDDARGKTLTKEEREKLTLVFKIIDGSLLEYVDNIKDVLNIFKDMDKTKAMVLIGACVIIASGYFAYKIIESNNDKTKFLMQNITIDNAIKTLERITIEALNSSKLRIEKATIGKNTLNRRQIQEIAEEMNNEDNNIEEKISAKFVVTKLYHKGNRKMATLTNKDYISIESGFAKDLFENNEIEFVNSFSKGSEIDCEVYIEKSQNGIIKKATLLKLNLAK
jgi:hypothetical protein